MFDRTRFLSARTPSSELDQQPCKAQKTRLRPFTPPPVGQQWGTPTRTKCLDLTAEETTNTRPQDEETFNDFQELSRLCVRGRKHSAMCLLRSAWLQEKREEVRFGAPFLLPSRNKLPRGAMYSGRIAEDSTFVIVLSYCWASPEHPDLENRLLANVSEFLAYLDVSRHFGDGRPGLEGLKVGDREVLVFWDWPCLYQKKD